MILICALVGMQINAGKSVKNGLSNVPKHDINTRLYCQRFIQFPSFAKVGSVCRKQNSQWHLIITSPIILKRLCVELLPKKDVDYKFCSPGISFIA